MVGNVWSGGEAAVVLLRVVWYSVVWYRIVS